MNYETLALVMMVMAIFNLGFGFWLGIKVAAWLVTTDQQGDAHD